MRCVSWFSNFPGMMPFLSVAFLTHLSKETVALPESYVLERVSKLLAVNLPAAQQCYSATPLERRFCFGKTQNA